MLQGVPAFLFLWPEGGLSTGLAAPVSSVSQLC